MVKLESLTECSRRRRGRSEGRSGSSRSPEEGGSPGIRLRSGSSVGKAAHLDCLVTNVKEYGSLLRCSQSSTENKRGVAPAGKRYACISPTASALQLKKNMGHQTHPETRNSCDDYRTQYVVNDCHDILMKVNAFDHTEPAFETGRLKRSVIHDHSPGAQL